MTETSQTPNAFRDALEQRMTEIVAEQTSPAPPLTAEEIEKLSAAIEKATPGDWYQSGQPWFRTGSGVLAGSPDPHVGYMILDADQWDGERAEYIENGGGVKIADADDDAAYVVAWQPKKARRLLSALAEKDRRIAEYEQRMHAVAEAAEPPLSENGTWSGTLAEAVAATAERATKAEARIAELVRERDEVNHTAQACAALTAFFYECQEKAESRATSAEALSAAAVERERVLRDRLAELIADTFGQAREPGEAMSESCNFMEWHTTAWLEREAYYRAALSSPAPGNGEAVGAADAPIPSDPSTPSSPAAGSEEQEHG
jgi:F0F1-type ATP synthase delta subunit